MNEGRTLLLLGAGGFLGTHLAPAAAESGLRVAAAGREPAGESLSCDLLDPASVRDCLGAVMPDLVVNAAGAASVGRSWERPAETLGVNAAGVLNLLEAVADQVPSAHVLCLSSADVYGVREEGELPLREDLEPRPVTPYGASKVAMEAICGQYARGRGLRIGIVRAFNLIGPGQASGFARRIAEAEQAGASEVELGLGNGSAVRDFVDVRDGARALLELSRRELCGTYNLCSGRGTTIAALVETLSRLARVAVKVRQEPGLERPADPPALVGDPQRLREAIGFEPAIPLSRSLEDLLDSCRAGAAGA